MNVSSTEPPFELSDIHSDFERLSAELGRRNQTVLPASSLYAWAALDLGLPYVNFTPSLGASVPGPGSLPSNAGPFMQARTARPARR